MILRQVRVLTEGGLSDPDDVEIAVRLAPDEIDATGLVLSPGWIDLHVHLREPGEPHKETFATGTRSAAAGGFTHLLAMANTRPALDRPVVLREAMAKAAGSGVRVSFAAALTIGQEGKTLTNAAELQKAGAAALSDDGRHAMSLSLLEQGLQQAASMGLPVFVHARYETGAPDAEAQATHDAIDVLRRVPNARLHFQHVSTAAAADAIRAAKASGLPVTAEATPHHLRLTARAVGGHGPDANVNPPLASAADREAVLRAVLDGTIDAVATDHAPHDPASKQKGAPGFHGFETALGVLLDLRLPWAVIHRACVRRPAEILGAGHVDDWLVIDPEQRWQVDPEKFLSLGRNTPFAGRRLRGSVVMTICRGMMVHSQAVPVG